MSVFLHHCGRCGVATNHLFIRVAEKKGPINVAVVACGECDDPPYQVSYSSQLMYPTCTAVALTIEGVKLNREMELNQRQGGVPCH